MVYSLKGRSVGGGDGLARVKKRCVRSDEGIAGDEADKHREDSVVTAFRALNDGGCSGSGHYSASGSPIPQ
jgi:hypothetical protein